MGKIKRKGLYKNIVMPDLDIDLKNMNFLYKLDTTENTDINNKLMFDYSNFLNANNLYLADEAFRSFNVLDDIGTYLQVSHYIYTSNKNTTPKNFRKYVNKSNEDAYRKLCNNSSKVFLNDILMNFFDYSFTVKQTKNKKFKQYVFMDNYGDLFAAMCKNAFKSPFRDTMTINFFDLNSNDFIERLNLEEFKSDFASFAFLNTFFSEILEVSKSSIEIDFLSELMLGIRTSIYLSKEIHELEQGKVAFNDNYLYDIFSVLIYVYIYPNVFNRKNLIDEILSNVYKWEYNPLNRFHKEISSDMADKFIDSVQSGKREYQKQVAQAILSFTTTSLPIIRAYTYNEFKNTNFYKKQLKNTINNYKKNSEDKKEGKKDIYDYRITISNPEELLKSQREKDIFCKLYRFLKMKLYNKKMMDIWQNAINLDFKENHTFKKIILSVLEYERVNLFENNVSAQYIPNTDDILHKLYQLLKTQYEE